jgi:hypothetical protein
MSLVPPLTPGLLSRIQPAILQKIPSFDFLVGFVEALQTAKEDLLKASPSAPLDKPGHDEKNTEPADIVFNNVIKQCLAPAIQQWDAITFQPRSFHPSGSNNPDAMRITRVILLADLCLKTSQTESHTRLLDLLLEKKEKNFKTFYSPLITQLRRRLSDLKIDFYAIFRDFLQHLIGIHLQTVSRRKTSGQI